MEINKQTLLAALQAASVGLATKEMIEQSTSIIFTKKGIYTYNDEVAVFAPLDGVDFEGAVSNKELTAFVTKGKEEAVTLSINPDQPNELLLTCGKSKAGLILDAEIKLPFLDYPEEQNALPKDFTDAVIYTLGSAGSDFSAPILTNLRIQGNTVISSDKYKLAKYECTESICEEELLVPAHQLSKFIRQGLASYGITEGWIHFLTTQGNTISCRLFQDKFPNVAPLLKFDKASKVDFPADIFEVLDKADIFTNSVSSVRDYVEIHAMKGRITIKARNEAGWYSENVKCKYAGEPLTFQISCSALRQILKKTSTGYINTNRIIFDEAPYFYMSALTLNTK